MSAYGYQRYDSMGDLPELTFDDPLDGGYLLVPPYNTIDTTLPMAHLSMGYQLPLDMSYQLPLDMGYQLPQDMGYQLPQDTGYLLPLDTGHAVTFFEDAIGASLAPLEAGVSFSNDSAEATLLPDDNQSTSATPRASKRKRRKSIRPPSARSRTQPQPITVRAEDRSQIRAPLEPHKPKKRGRKRLQLKDVTDDDTPAANPRRRRVLERNRESALKCRDRKRSQAERLAFRERAVEDQHHELLKEVDSLTEEIYYLKTQLLRHSDCGCVTIQKYIAKQAKDSVDGMMDASLAVSSHADPPSPDYSGPSTVDSMSLQSPATDGAQTPRAGLQSPADLSDLDDEWFDLDVESCPKVPAASAPVMFTSMSEVQHIPG